MSHEGAPEIPPPPARRLPEFALLWRGLVLVCVAVAALWGAASSAKHLLLVPLSLALTAIAVLSAWAGAIHLTGGEKTDDHPWV